MFSKSVKIVMYVGFKVKVVLIGIVFVMSNLSVVSDIVLVMMMVIKI